MRLPRRSGFRAAVAGLAQSGGLAPPPANCFSLTIQGRLQYSGNVKEVGDHSTRKALDELTSVLAHCDDPRLIREFLQSILTANEVKEIATRWALVRLIDIGRSQRSIARELGLSLCKITRGSKELKKRNSAFRQMVESYKGIVQSA